MSDGGDIDRESAVGARAGFRWSAARSDRPDSRPESRRGRRASRSNSAPAARAGRPDRRSADRARGRRSSVRAMSCRPSPSASGISPAALDAGARVGIGVGGAGARLDAPGADPVDGERAAIATARRGGPQAQRQADDGDQNSALSKRSHAFARGSSVSAARCASSSQALALMARDASARAVVVGVSSAAWSRRRSRSPPRFARGAGEIADL